MYSKPEMVFCASAGLALAASVIILAEVLGIPGRRTCSAVEDALLLAGRIVHAVLEGSMSLTVFLVTRVHNYVGCGSHSKPLLDACVCIATVFYPISILAYASISPKKLRRDKRVKFM